MYYRQCGDLPIHPFRSNENMSPFGGNWMSMLMLTEGDARYAAAYLNMQDDGFTYVYHPNFMGYEGPDYGVSQHLKTLWGHAGAYRQSVCRDHLAHICWDRPIVPQAEAFDHREI
jgi:hypothetical protein